MAPGCYAGFLFGREAARRMAPRGRGHPFHRRHGLNARLGAVRRVRRREGGLRQVAQSMARELGPKNIHVAHVVIDGVIDNRRSREDMAQHVKSLPDAALLAADAIAELFGSSTCMRSAWTFEADLRPWAEKF